jgi:hypothetical protein
MNWNFKIGIVAVLAFVGLIAVSASMLPHVSTNENTDPFHQGISYRGHVEVYKIPAGTETLQKIADKDNLLVTNGKTYIRTQIGSGGAVASSSAKYISLSNDATSPNAAWLDIPTEITTNALGRAAATYATNGTGAWNMTYTWTATGAQSAQLTGLSYGGTPADNTLFAALQFASVTLATNDQLRVIWSISVS